MAQKLTLAQSNLVPTLHVNEGSNLVHINLVNYIHHKSHDSLTFSMLDARQFPPGILLTKEGVLSGKPRRGSASSSPYYLSITVTNGYDSMVIKVTLFVHESSDTASDSDYNLDDLVTKETLRRIELGITDDHVQQYNGDISVGRRRPERTDNSNQAGNALQQHPLLDKRATQKQDGMPETMTNDARSNPDSMPNLEQCAPENRPSHRLAQDNALTASPGNTPTPN